MANRIKKYNPAFLSSEELIRTFVVRHTELELIVRVIRENVGQSNQHILVIGPRGIGKMGPNLTTHHSWAGSIVISNNTWIYTQIVDNPDKSWSYNYSYAGYKLGRL